MDSNRITRKRSQVLTLIIAAVLSGGTALADDGEKVLKRMTGGSIDKQLTVLPVDIGLQVSEAEHAFTDMMKFYVPSQAASGVLTPVEYYDADGGLVETLEVAKPLVNVFIYGPAVGVPDTPFAHSFMDTFAAVSLDDGVTWKTTNLSESADQSSFELGSNRGGKHSHDADDDHAANDQFGPTITKATWNDNQDVLKVEGKDAEPKVLVTVLNATTGAALGSVTSKTNGNWSVTVTLGAAPCMVAAEAEGAVGPSVSVRGAPDDCEGADLTDYPGGTYNVFHATAGNKVLVAWPSRYCRQGQPAYAYAYDGDDTDKDVAKRDAIAAYIGTDVMNDLYLTDLFGVAGSQNSINFADEDYPQAGEVPFGCVWTARGVLLPGDDPRTSETESSHMVWTKAERLTSGHRDPNRIEVKGVQGAGFVITWQEDPDGLRPGQGEGPGEGWSGAVAHSKTDVWYSFIRWEHFDQVEIPDNPLSYQNIVDHDLTVSGRPQAFVPMAVPMRLTNNDKCVPGVTTERFSYCNYEVAQNYGLQDFCADTVQIPQGPNDELQPICVNADGLPNIANTGSTRPRTSLQGYTRTDGTPSAWMIVAAEESKGLGRYTFLPDGTSCEEDRTVPECTSDIGKNQWYFSFDMGGPDTSATAAEEQGLVQNLVNQGNLLNQPEVDWRTGEFYSIINTSEMWDFGAYNYDLYNTEIARRSSLLVQSIGKALASSGKLLAIPSWKQGAMRQGGPADTMLRRIVLPTGYVEGIENNPYAFTHVDCRHFDGTSGWILQDGSNPYYPDGICIAPATNLSSVVPDACIDTATDQPTECPSVTFDGSSYGIGDTNPILQGFEQGEGNTQKVLTWHQCPSSGVQSTGDITAVSCDTDDRTDAFVNLRDQSWYNPLDVSKGHRGFIDGDFVMFLYAWSPNWRLNAKGSDRYDLYVRRSFNGGESWTTLPPSFKASDTLTYSGDGTVSCDTYRSEVTQSPQAEEPQVCYEYIAGGDEQARNVTQHSRMRITTLDPRYAPTAASIAEACVDDLDPTIDTAVMTCDDLSTEHDSDLRDPSRYFMVYETGDNSTVEEGEAEPLDLFYSRAESFGDDYLVWAETDSDTNDPTLCYPSDPHGDEVSATVVGSLFCNEFDRLNAAGDTHSSEANLEANPNGSKLYAVWAQWMFDSSGEEVAESDAMARRVWWIDDYIPSDAWEALIGGGQQ